MTGGQSGAGGPTGPTNPNPSSPAGTTGAPAGSPASTPEAQPKKPIFALIIKDKPVLFAAYMPFVGGGLFIPTQRDFQWGEEVTLNLTLMEETEKFVVQAKVVWITPKKAQGNRSPGVGVQFLHDEGKRLRDKIETYLAGMLESTNPTHTL